MANANTKTKTEEKTEEFQVLELGDLGSLGSRVSSQLISSSLLETTAKVMWLYWAAAVEDRFLWSSQLPFGNVALDFRLKYHL